MTTRTDPARLARQTIDHRDDQPPTVLELSFQRNLARMSDRELAALYYRLSSSARRYKGLVASAHLHGQMIAIEQEQKDRAERNRNFRVSLWRGLGLLGCIIALAMCAGCASTHTVLRIGLHADLTDVVNGCDRKLDAYCGLKGPRDIAVIEFLYLPTARFDRTFNPYVGWLHKSHYSAGFPVNKEFEQIVDAPGVGGFIQFGGKK